MSTKTILLAFVALLTFLILSADASPPVPKEKATLPSAQLEPVTIFSSLPSLDTPGSPLTSISEYPKNLEQRDSAINSTSAYITEWHNLYFCPGSDFDLGSCLEEAILLNDDPDFQLCYNPPSGYLKGGQTMWNKEFSCNVFTNDACIEGGARETGWYSGHLIINPGPAGDTVWKTYHCWLGTTTG